MIVFALLMLVIVYSYRSREKRYRDYYLWKHSTLPFPGDRDWERLIAEGAGVEPDENGDSLVFDPLTRLLYRCSGEGALTILRQGDNEDPVFLQELPAPKHCRRLALDLQTGKIYLLAGEELWIYTNGLS